MVQLQCHLKNIKAIYKAYKNFLGFRVLQRITNVPNRIQTRYENISTIQSRYEKMMMRLLLLFCFVDLMYLM